MPSREREFSHLKIVPPRKGRTTIMFLGKAGKPQRVAPKLPGPKSKNGK